VSVIEAIEAAIGRAASDGERPVVVVDVDSTVVLSGERHRRILIEYAEDRDRDDLRALAQATTTLDYRWSVDEPLRRAGLADEALLADLVPYWRERFFSDAFGALDLPAPGARDVVQRWADAGALIVWLTARPAARMAACTEGLLRRWGFPLLDGTALLLMKDDGVSDGEHKVQAFATIGRLGRVVAVLDNEPGHVNAAAEAFPGALAVLVGDICSPDAPPLDARAVRLPGWRSG
jgi:hypothetical protein